MRTEHVLSEFDARQIAESVVEDENAQEFFEGLASELEQAESTLAIMSNLFAGVKFQPRDYRDLGASAHRLRQELVAMGYLDE